MLSSPTYWLNDLIGLPTIPTLGPTSPVNSRGQHPHAYQFWMADKIVEIAYLLLAAHPGLGKTWACLEAMRRLLESGEVRAPVLVSAPLLVSQETWPDEVGEWSNTKGMTYSVAVGTERERLLAIRKKVDLHIVNRENLVWLHDQWSGRPFPYDMLVYDEASRLKGGKKRTPAGKGLRQDGTPKQGRNMSEFGAVAKMRPHFKRVVELSGTPAPNGEHDLWGPIYVLDQGSRLGTSMTAFENRWFEKNPWSHSIKPHDHAEKEIMSLISDLMFSLHEDDYLTLPPLIPKPIKLTFPPAIMERYRTFERELYDKEFDVEALSNGVLVNKLLQFCSGSLYLSDKTSKKVHDLKLSALESVVEETKGSPLLIAYSYKFDVDTILKKYPKFRVIGDHKNWKADWNAGRIPGLITHPAQAAHGLNIQFGGNNLVFYGLQWSLEYFKQMIKRLHRQGQAGHHVFMYYILIKETADVTVWNALTAKGAKQDSIFDAVRVRLEKSHAR